MHELNIYEQQRPSRTLKMQRQKPKEGKNDDNNNGSVWESCMLCKSQQKKAVMLQNGDDEYLCQECFRKEFYDSTGPEDVAVEPNSDEDENVLLFPYLEPLMKTEKIKSKFHKNPKSSTISKRPVVCPYAQCQRHVGVLAFDSHFKYEHTDVPVIATHLDSRTSVHFYPQDLTCGIKHCVLLLNVLDEGDVAHKSPSFTLDSSGRAVGTSSSRKENAVCFVLLATKVADLQLSDGDGEPQEPGALLLADRRDGADDRIFVWLCSNVATELGYTVAASTLDNETRVKYCGPVPALPSSPGHRDVEGEDPVEMCECGRGLVLASFQHRGMTDGGGRPLVLDVVVHPADD